MTATMAKVMVLALFGMTGAARISSTSTANPIRKIVGMLQNMEKKVQEEGEAEAELYKKFQCYCTNGEGALQNAITAAENKIPKVTSAIETGVSELAQLKEDLKNHKADRQTAKSDMSEATTLREKEAAAYAAGKAEGETNQAALNKAVAALEKGAGGSFLQTEGAATLKHLAIDKLEMSDESRETILSFLSGSEDYAPQSGQITGILKQMGDEMAKDLADADANEKTAIASFEELMAAKTKEVATLTESIEVKSVRVGEVAVANERNKQDLKDTEEQMAEDKKFLQNLDKTCAAKAKEWDLRQKMRADELSAIADTIKILNDDDALELFKKTLPAAASLLQVRVTAAATRANALSFLRHAKVSKRHRDILALQLDHQMPGGFNKVLDMIDGMIASLEKEQTDEEAKKKHCEKELATQADHKKELETAQADAQADIDAHEESIATTTQEIADTKQSIKDLDKQVAEATTNRKEENAAFTQLMTQDTAAKEIIGMAKNRLNKFYNPTQYKAPPKVEMAEELAQTGAAPPPPPETFGAYSKKSGESSGVIGMMDTFIADLDKEMTEAKMEEKHAQQDYEELMKDSADERVELSKSLTNKEAALADLKVELERHVASHADATRDIQTVDKMIISVHQDCDFTLKWFEARTQMRHEEIDALHKEKTILKGDEA